MVTKASENLPVLTPNIDEPPVTDGAAATDVGGEQGVFDARALSVLQSVFNFSGQESYDATFSALANGLGSNESAAEDGCAKTARVKFMITRQDEVGLRGLGYSQAQIDKLTPQEAHDILQAGSSAEPRVT